MMIKLHFEIFRICLPIILVLDRIVGVSLVFRVYLTEILLLLFLILQVWARFVVRVEKLRLFLIFGRSNFFLTAATAKEASLAFSFIIWAGWVLFYETSKWCRLSHEWLTILVGNVRISRSLFLIVFLVCVVISIIFLIFLLFFAFFFFFFMLWLDILGHVDLVSENKSDAQ